MMIQFQNRLIDESLTVPDIFLILDNRQIDTFFAKIPVHIYLINHLILQLIQIIWIAIACQNQKRHFLVICLCHRWYIVTSCCRGCAGNRHRLAQFLRQSQCEVSGASLVYYRIAVKVIIIFHGMCQRYMACSG